MNTIGPTNLSNLVSIGLVLPAIVSSDFLIGILERNYKNYNAGLTNDQKELLTNLEDRVQNKGVVLTINKLFLLLLLE